MSARQGRNDVRECVAWREALRSFRGDAGLRGSETGLVFVLGTLLRSTTPGVECAAAGRRGIDVHQAPYFVASATRLDIEASVAIQHARQARELVRNPPSPPPAPESRPQTQDNEPAATVGKSRVPSAMARAVATCRGRPLSPPGRQEPGHLRHEQFRCRVHRHVLLAHHHRDPTIRQGGV